MRACIVKELNSAEKGHTNRTTVCDVLMKSHTVLGKS